MNSNLRISLVLMLMVATLCEAAENPPPEPKAGATANENADVAISIHGNQEQPTVLYIVPWQDATDNRILQEPSKPVLQQVFQQIERKEHQREIHYLLNLEGGEKEAP